MLCWSILRTRRKLRQLFWIRWVAAMKTASVEEEAVAMIALAVLLDVAAVEEEMQ